MYDATGNTMVDVGELGVKGICMIMKGKILGYLSGTFFIWPEEMAKVFSILTWGAVAYLPAMIVKGLQKPKAEKPA